MGLRERKKERGGERGKREGREERKGEERVLLVRGSDASYGVLPLIMVRCRWEGREGEERKERKEKKKKKEREWKERRKGKRVGDHCERRDGLYGLFFNRWWR